MAADPDGELLLRLRDDRAEVRRLAEHELFERFRGPVARLLHRMLGDDLDDCLQEVFVDLFRGLRGFAGAAKLSTWVWRVALRRSWKCSAERRRVERGREEEAPPIEQAVAPRSAGDVEAAVAGDELARRFAAALQRLDLDQRTVLALAARDGLAPAEMAEVLGLPLGTVHSRLGRARARMRELLGLCEAGVAPSLNVPPLRSRRNGAP
ncbi:MAG: sigma-70 family RNA polymerase sigma factor [Planctomycetes bacterium]|nr:sigma-70 family RNA polymerase sigma factor [Planctomycetota bacterium]